MKPNGGPAFPIAFMHDHGHEGWHLQEWEGLSLRDYFASAILPALLQSSPPSWHPEKFTAAAYQLADAMIAEREKE